MNSDYFRLLYDYSYWARDRVLAAAGRLSEDVFAAPNGFTYGSVRGILTHALATEALYVQRWQGTSPTARIVETDVPTLALLSARWREEEERMRAFLASLEDADLAREIVSQTRGGREYRRPLVYDLTQISNHATQHRSEAAEACTIAGSSPGDLDFSVYLQERPAAQAR